ncbi:MAG: LysM peptidoglycan-binding domain-containing protein [Pseudomonadota bacterium]
MKSNALFSKFSFYPSKKLNLKTYLIYILGLILCFLSLSFIQKVNAAGDHIKLNANHPDTYTVVKGDTLWDISGKFLQQPWQWPEIWEVNPQIKNPHLIYPGDELVFSYVDGQPRVRRINNGQRPTFKLSPRKRITELNLAIPTIKLEKIAPFLTGNRIVDKSELQKSPYVVGTSEEHLIAAAGHEVYVKNLSAQEKNYRFGFYHKGRRYVNPYNKKETLGYEAIYLGEGTLVRKGNPATIKIIKSKAEIINGSRLLTLNDDEFNSNFLPKAAQTKKIGLILGSLASGIQSGLNNVAAADVVLVNFGESDGIEVGDVFNVYRKGKVILDPIKKSSKITLPNEFAGNMLIFKTAKKMSYAIIMDANQVIKVGDLVVSPYMVQQ